MCSENQLNTPLYLSFCVISRLFYSLQETFFLRRGANRDGVQEPAVAVAHHLLLGLFRPHDFVVFLIGGEGVEALIGKFEVVPHFVVIDVEEELVAAAAPHHLHLDIHGLFDRLAAQGDDVRLPVGDIGVCLGNPLKTEGVEHPQAVEGVGDVVGGGAQLLFDMRKGGLVVEGVEFEFQTVAGVDGLQLFLGEVPQEDGLHASREREVQGEEQVFHLQAVAFEVERDVPCHLLPHAGDAQGAVYLPGGGYGGVLGVVTEAVVAVHRRVGNHVLAHAARPFQRPLTPDEQVVLIETAVAEEGGIGAESAVGVEVDAVVDALAGVVVVFDFHRYADVRGVQKALDLDPVVFQAGVGKRQARVAGKMEVRQAGEEGDVALEAQSVVQRERLLLLERRLGEDEAGGVHADFGKADGGFLLLLADVEVVPRTAEAVTPDELQGDAGEHFGEIAAIAQEFAPLQLGDGAVRGDGEVAVGGIEAPVREVDVVNPAAFDVAFLEVVFRQGNDEAQGVQRGIGGDEHVAPGMGEEFLILGAPHFREHRGFLDANVEVCLLHVPGGVHERTAVTAGGEVHAVVLGVIDKGSFVGSQVDGRGDVGGVHVDVLVEDGGEVQRCAGGFQQGVAQMEQAGIQSSPLDRQPPGSVHHAVGDQEGTGVLDAPGVDVERRARRLGMQDAAGGHVFHADLFPACRRAFAGHGIDGDFLRPSSHPGWQQQYRVGIEMAAVHVHLPVGNESAAVKRHPAGDASFPVEAQAVGRRFIFQAQRVVLEEAQGVAYRFHDVGIERPVEGIADAVRVVDAFDGVGRDAIVEAVAVVLSPLDGRLVEIDVGLLGGVEDGEACLPLLAGFIVGRIDEDFPFDFPDEGVDAFPPALPLASCHEHGGGVHLGKVDGVFVIGEEQFPPVHVEHPGVQLAVEQHVAVLHHHHLPVERLHVDVMRPADQEVLDPADVQVVVPDVETGNHPRPVRRGEETDVVVILLADPRLGVIEKAPLQGHLVRRLVVIHEIIVGQEDNLPPQLIHRLAHETGGVAKREGVLAQCPGALEEPVQRIHLVQSLDVIIHLVAEKVHRLDGRLEQAGSAAHPHLHIGAVQLPVNLLHPEKNLVVGVPERRLEALLADALDADDPLRDGIGKGHVPVDNLPRIHRNLHRRLPADHPQGVEVEALGAQFHAYRVVRDDMQQRRMLRRTRPEKLSPPVLHPAPERNLLEYAQKGNVQIVRGELGIRCLRIPRVFQGVVLQLPRQRAPVFLLMVEEYGIRRIARQFQLDDITRQVRRHLRLPIVPLHKTAAPLQLRRPHQIGARGLPDANGVLARGTHQVPFLEIDAQRHARLPLQPAVHPPAVAAPVPHHLLLRHRHRLLQVSLHLHPFPFRRREQTLQSLQPHLQILPLPPPEKTVHAHHEIPQLRRHRHVQPLQSPECRRNAVPHGSGPIRRRHHRRIPLRQRLPFRRAQTLEHRLHLRRQHFHILRMHRRCQPQPTTNP